MRVGLRQLARQTGKDRGHLSRVERGDRDVTPALVLAYERALGTTVAATATLGTPATKFPGQAQSFNFSEMEKAGIDRPNVELPYYTEAEGNSIQRRRFLAWLSSLSAGLVAIPESMKETIAFVNQQPDTLRCITAGDVANLRATTDMFKAWDYRVGGGLSRHAVVSQFSWAVHQLSNGVPVQREVLRLDWMRATALLAAVAGWKNHDAGFEQPGRQILTLGYRLAGEADDRAMQAYLVGAMVKQSVHVGHPHVGLDLARHGLSLADEGTPILCSMLHVLKARAYAYLGEPQNVAREIGLAEQEFARIVPEHRAQEPWLNFYVDAELHGDAGTAWRLLIWHHSDQPTVRQLRSVENAGTRLSIAANRYGDDFARSRALCNLMAASVYMKANDPEAAVATDTSTTALDIGSVHSTRVDGYLRDLVNAAQPFTNRGDVQQMLAQPALV
jgi:transcriptional regulator with XRE-family HTH domain